MIDLDDEDYHELVDILHTHLKGCKVYAFGSRVRGNNQQFSDVDLYIEGDDQIQIETLLDLREALSESNLPVFIDLVDNHAISEEFALVLEKSEKILIMSTE